MQFVKSWLVDLFHFHKWKILSQGDVVDDYRDKVGTYHTVQCTHCGKLKKFTLVSSI